jgi:hypothetical protein
LLEIGIIEQDYSTEWVSMLSEFEIPKKNGTIAERVVTDFRKLNLLLNRLVSPISYSKDWEHDPYKGMVYLCHSIELKYGLLSYQNRS